MYRIQRPCQEGSEQINFISGILTSLKGVFDPPSGLVSIEMGEGSIKLAMVRISRTKCEITALKQAELLSKDDDGISREVKAFLGPLGMLNQRIFLNVPRRCVTVRLLKFPSTNDEEIGKISKTEALKYVPFGDEDVISSYRIIEKFDDGYSSVLLAVVLAGTLRRTIDILRSVGVRDIGFVALGCESLFLWHQLAMDQKSQGSVLVLDLDANSMDINIIWGDDLLFTRGIHYGLSGQLTKEKVLAELRASLVAYKKESNKTVDSVVITGILDQARGWEGVVAREFGLPVKVIDQISNVPLKEGIEIDTNKASFAGLLGLSLRPNDAKIDLLPKDIAISNRQRAWQKDFSSTLILGGLIFALITGLMVKMLNDKALALAQIKTKIEKISPAIIKTKKMLNYIKIVEETGRKPLAIDIVSELYKLTPAEILLNRVDYEENVSLTVSGISPNLDGVLKYVEALGSSAYLKGVKVKNAGKREAGGGDAVAFEITCTLSKDGK